jgi:transposase-like protein
MKGIVPEQAGVEEPRSVLDELVHQGAQDMLAKALESEIQDFLERHGSIVDGDGRRQIVRNGHLPERQVLTGAGALTVSQPRARDRRDVAAEDKVRFTSSVLPPYLRRSKNIDDLIPWLYLRGVSTGDFSDALQALVGPQAKGLSANVVTRLLEGWQGEYDVWNRRALSGKEYVYLWADGIHFNVRLEEDRQCILVLMGATEDGHKELLGILDGFRESEQNWHELLCELKARGLTKAPQLAVGDGALGFWKALRKAFPETREQRCWVHKTANVLNKLPKQLQKKAKSDLQDIWMAEKREVAFAAFDRFVEKYGAKYPKASNCLSKDRDALLTLYDFPAEHWIHLRTTNPIESTFATVRLRHRRTKGNGNRRACLAMVFKLVCAAQQKWRRLNGHERIAKLLAGYSFVDGIMQKKDAA